MTVGDLEVVYDDGELIAIDKPAGLLVHRSPIDRHERRFALQMVRDLVGRRVHAIHRLDKPTSGVLLLARSAEAAGRLSTLFRGAGVRKRYVAVVRGHVHREITIDHPLRPLEDSRAEAALREERREAVTVVHPRAVTVIDRPVDIYPEARYSLVELVPRTGRRHQLRRHMKHIAHPIVGDPKYGKSVHNAFFRDHFGISRLLLHACSLSFVHPLSGEAVHIAVRIPREFTLPFEGAGSRWVSESEVG